MHDRAPLQSEQDASRRQRSSARTIRRLPLQPSREPEFSCFRDICPQELDVMVKDSVGAEAVIDGVSGRSLGLR
jgi:hypothetical protein